MPHIMDNSIQKQFANLYPSSNIEYNNNSKTPVNDVINPPIRYSLQQDLNQPEIRNNAALTYGKWAEEHKQNSKEGFTPKQAIKPVFKKLLVTLFIAAVGAFLYSAFAYTFTDHITSGLELSLFNTHGQPSVTVIILHTIIFSVLIYIILTITKV